MAVLIMAIGISGCEKDDPVPVNSSPSGNSTMAGTWKISYFELNGVKHTDVFDMYTFEFKNNDVVEVTGGGKKVTGKWTSSQNKFSLDFGLVDPFTVLNNSAWDIGSQSSGLLELKGKTGTDGTAVLTFRRT